MVSRKVKKTGSKPKKLPPFPALHQVTAQWALCFAGLYAAVAFRAINRPGDGDRASPSWWSSTYQPAPTDAAEATALLRAHLWCGAPQAAAAALALLLPAGTRRRALALFALAATAVNHDVLARLLGLLCAAGGRPPAQGGRPGHLRCAGHGPARLPGPPHRRPGGLASLLAPIPIYASPTQYCMSLASANSRLDTSSFLIT